jgi:hypothetical protein
MFSKSNNKEQIQLHKVTLDLQNEQAEDCYCLEQNIPPPGPGNCPVSTPRFITAALGEEQ